MSIGGPEILVILVLALLVFGPTRLPEIGRQLGKALRELRNIEHRVKSEISDALDIEGTHSEQARAPQYGDPTNVPEPAPEPAEEPDDSHDAPPPEFNGEATPGPENAP
ncbi:MAG: Sec-independent protein translocase subunit TatA/TatB [Acidimicrobiia bacterium]